MNIKQRNISGIVLLLLLIGFFVMYFILFMGNTTSSDKEYFYIKSSDTYLDVQRNLADANFVKSTKTFEWVADKMNLENTYKAGRYKIEAGMSNVSLVRSIRSGNWDKVIVKIGVEMTRDSIVKYLADNLEFTEKEIQNAVDGSWVADNDFTNENKWVVFLPDHYHFNWATSAPKTIKRFVEEYKKYWTESRLSKATAQGLTAQEAVVLASIVDGEAIHVDEMPTIAGLYLNRLKKGILLQSDPTVLYVVGREGRQRVLNKDLRTADPYNTYQNIGLPPGPLFAPDKRAIEAVLHPQKHNYIFMCAKPDGTYRHNFTSSSIQHNRNAAAYRRSLDRQGVRR